MTSPWWTNYTLEIWNQNNTPPSSLKLLVSGIFAATRKASTTQPLGWTDLPCHGCFFTWACTTPMCLAELRGWWGTTSQHTSTPTDTEDCQLNLKVPVILEGSRFAVSGNHVEIVWSGENGPHFTHSSKPSGVVCSPDKHNRKQNWTTELQSAMILHDEVSSRGL